MDKAITEADARAALENTKKIRDFCFSALGMADGGTYAMTLALAIGFEIDAVSAGHHPSRNADYQRHAQAGYNILTRAIAAAIGMAPHIGLEPIKQPGPGESSKGTDSPWAR